MHMDRFLLISPLAGMGCFGDIPLPAAIVLAAGLYVADAVAERFEIMRVVWWPLCYAGIGFGLVRHLTLTQFSGVVIGFVAVSTIIVLTHMPEVRRVWHKLRP